MQKTSHNFERKAVVDARYTYVEQRLQAFKTNKTYTKKQNLDLGPPIHGGG